MRHETWYSSVDLNSVRSSEFGHAKIQDVQGSEFSGSTQATHISSAVFSSQIFAGFDKTANFYHECVRFHIGTHLLPLHYRGQ